jgi:hypothetical protein
MKKILLVSILLIPLMLITTPMTYAGEPPPCGTSGWILMGPPVVGTLVIDYKSGADPYITNSYDFSGCCADCFGRCNSSCNVRIYFEKTLNVLPEEITAGQLLNYNVTARGPKNCFSKQGGEDLVIMNVLKLDYKDIDRDGMLEAVADIVMFYWQCNP